VPEQVVVLAELQGLEPVQGELQQGPLVVEVEQAVQALVRVLGREQVEQLEDFAY